MAELNRDTDPLAGDLARDSGARAAAPVPSPQLAGTIVMPGAAAGRRARWPTWALPPSATAAFLLDTTRLAATLEASPTGVAAMLTNGIYGVFASVDRLAVRPARQPIRGRWRGSLARLHHAQKTKLASEQTN